MPLLINPLLLLSRSLLINLSFLLKSLELLRKIVVKRFSFADDGIIQVQDAIFYYSNFTVQPAALVDTDFLLKCLRLRKSFMQKDLHLRGDHWITSNFLLYRGFLSQNLF